MKNQNNDIYSLAHTTWKCQYHIVFAPKYRRKIIYGTLKIEIGKILKELCRRKDVELIEGHAMPDHIHMLVSIPPNQRGSRKRQYSRRAGRNEVTLKRYYEDSEKRQVRLHPENPTMSDTIVKSCKIQGVAIKAIKDLSNKTE